MSKRIKGPLPRGKHFIAEWRQFRGLSQAALAEKMATTNASISRVETYESAYTQDFLEACAHALDCLPQDLISGPPDQDTEIKLSLRRLSKGQQSKALRLLHILLEEQDAQVDPSSRPMTLAE